MICRWLISRLRTTNGLSLYCFDSTAPKDVFGLVKTFSKGAQRIEFEREGHLSFVV